MTKRVTKRPARVPARAQESRLAFVATEQNSEAGSFRMLAVKAEGALQSTRPSP